MTVELFFQNSSTTTTLAEIRRIHDLVEATETFSLFAYATQSGLAAFELEFGEEYWKNTATKWLFGIDYGRTQPQAMRNLIDKPNTEVRIYDGAWLVNQEGFLPRHDFHLKTTFLLKPCSDKFGVVAGSGNFSSNGLKKSIEAGTAIYTEGYTKDTDFASSGLSIANLLWENSTPVDAILDAYQDKWRNSFSRVTDDSENTNQILSAQNIFWIETGYVTKNRGPDKPGNQIDLPRGMSKYFGLQSSANQPLNSNIGEINFITPDNGPIKRNLRLGNNSMEKITLPIPETHGFDIYDGKILVFRRSGASFLMSALEGADFEASFGDKLSTVMMMSSGRRYGHIE